MRIGYLRVEAIKPLDLFQDWRVVARNELGELVRATHAIAIGKVDSVAEQLNTQMSALEPFVDEVVAK